MTASTPRQSVERYVTADRLGPYLSEAAGDFDKAEKLYIWNLRMAGALHEALGVFEIVIRNALCEQLRNWHGQLAGSWLDDPRGVLERNRIDQIEDARRFLIDRGKTATEGRVVAELPFGFWRYLLTRRYEHSLWTPHLRKAFPLMKPQNRDKLYLQLDSLHALRNRVAHHEPVHKHALALKHKQMVDIVSWVDADMGSWLVGISRVPKMLQVKP